MSLTTIQRNEIDKAITSLKKAGETKGKIFLKDAGGFFKKYKGDVQRLMKEIVKLHSQYRQNKVSPAMYKRSLKFYKSAITNYLARGVEETMDSLLYYLWKFITMVCEVAKKLFLTLITDWAKKKKLNLKQGEKK